MGIPPETWEDIVETERWLRVNKIHHWSWHILAMSGKPNKTDQSEFERDPIKYGFTFPNPNDFNDWRHDFVTRDEVAVWYKRLAKEAPPYIMRRHGCWGTVEVLNYCDKETVLNVDLKDYHQEVKDKRTDWIQLYMDMIQALPAAE
jgi:hypothetical protein